MVANNRKHLVIPLWLFDALSQLKEPGQTRTGVVIAMFNQLHNPPRNKDGKFTKKTVVLNVIEKKEEES